MMNKEELKPCPFCGGETKIIQRINSFKTVCKCEAEMVMYIDHKGNINRAKMDLIKAWNHRQPTTERETVEEWEARTGKVYPDDGPVWGWEYYESPCKDWDDPGEYFLAEYVDVKDEYINLIVANHLGKPKDTP